MPCCAARCWKTSSEWNCGSSATVTSHRFNGLRALAELTGSRFRRGVVLYTGSAAVPFGPKLVAMPVSSLWQIGDKMPPEA